jgi:CspA family cold shock protein
MMHGSVTRVVLDKGFGFIRADNGRAGDYFFHRSGCRCSFDTLGAGVRVTFTPTDGPKGPRAEDVSLED